mmetsp:Transcript_6691/g.11481  ORF Transcript_6691/g.11481 Transcript_6691/m.11481 type:complete len:668 (-) Transcript_6691:136-2139(-)
MSMCGANKSSPSRITAMHSVQDELVQTLQQQLHKQQQQTDQGHSTAHEWHRVSQLLEIVVSLKEQNHLEFEKVKEQIEGVHKLQKAFLERQKTLQEAVGQQKTGMDRQENLVQQLLDQASLDKAMQQGSSTNVNPRIAGMHNIHDMPSEPIIGDDQESEGSRQPMGGYENGMEDPKKKHKKKKKGHHISEMVGDISSKIIGKKSKKGKDKSFDHEKSEGRSRTSFKFAPWNRDHDHATATFNEEDDEQYNQEEQLFPCLARMARSSYFKTFFGFVILANTVFVAVQVQHTAEHPEQQAPPLYITCSDIVFCMLFSFEIIVRMLTERCAFFKGQSRHWNYFDLFLVLLALQEQVSSFVLIARGNINEVMEGKDDSGSGDFTFFRLVRVLRVLRVLRVFKIFPQMIVLVKGIWQSLFTMVWLFVFFFLTLLTASLVFMSATADFVKSVYGEPETQHLTDMKASFGSLSDASYSLFKVVSGGLEWGKLGDGLMKISLVYGGLFICYLAFVIFGIVNVMTGVFVASAMKTAKAAEEEIKRRHFADMRSYLDTLTSDVDPDMLARDIFLSEVELEEGPMKDLLKPLELSPADAAHLFDLMMDSEQKVSPNKLGQGFLRIIGGARSTDLVFLLLETRRLANELFGFFCFAEANFRTQSTAMGVQNGPRRYLEA